MRIGIQTWGSEGDIRPFVGLAEGFARAGHEVTLAYTSVEDRDYGDRLAAAGFRHRKVGNFGKPAQELRALAQRVVAERDPLKQLDLVMQHHFLPVEEAMLTAAQELCAGSDVVLRHLLLYPTMIAAERANVPVVTVSPAPALPTGAFPPPGTPALGGWLNRLLWRFGLWILDRNLRPAVQRLRAQLGLPPVARVAEQDSRAVLNLVAASPTLLPRPDDWPAHAHVCGFLNALQPPVPWSPPAGLEEFLSAGSPPVYVTFGSMAMAESDPVGLARLVQEAVLAAGCRAIVQFEPASFAGLPEHPSIHRIGSAPHERLFPRCAAVVHHGGAGTTQAALLAGRASVVVAYITDQFFWSAALRRHGAAVPLRRTGLTAAGLAAALRRVTSDPALQERARDLGERMRREDGVAEAVRLVTARVR